MEVYKHNAENIAGEPPKTPHGKVRRFSVCVLAALFWLVSCVSLCMTMSACGAKSGVGGESARLYEKVCRSVVQVYDEGEGHAGSGVIFEIRDGNTYILTNRHVVPSGSVAKVRFDRYAEKADAEILGYDAYHDIAILCVEGSYGTAAVFAEDEPVAGMRALAVGNNLGYGIAAFDGIVSHTSRMIKVDDLSGGGEKVVPVYAVTCAINRGMSGGGVFDEDGKLLGIGTYQASLFDGEPVQDMNYIVPASVAKAVARRVIYGQERGQIDRLDITAESFTDADRTADIVFGALCFSARFTPEGLQINTVLYPEGQPPFELQGGAPQTGDVVTKFGDVAVSRETSYAAVYAEALRYAHAPTETTPVLKVQLRRGDAALTLTYSSKHLVVS